MPANTGNTTVETTAATAPAAKSAAPSNAASGKTTTLKAASTSSSTTLEGQSGPSIIRVIDDGIYLIASAKNTTRLIDVSGESKANGANVMLWNGHGGKNQQWRFTFDPKTGCYKIVCMNSGKALTYQGSAISGANVVQKTVSATNAQLWSVVKTAKGYALSPLANSKLMLEVQGGKALNGDNVDMRTSNGEVWQRFWLVALDPKLKASKTLNEGAYTIARADAQKQLVDVSGESQDNGADALVYHSTGGMNQRWYLTRDKGNFYTITSINSGKVLDVCGASFIPGSAVIQYAGSGQANQKWQVRDNGDGTFSFVSKANGLVLGSAGTADCSKVKVFVDKPEAAVRFVLKPVKLIGDGVYSMASRQKIAEVVDVPGESKKNGTQLALWSFHGNLNQKYQFVDTGSEVYTIQIADSAKFLEDSGGKVVQNNAKSSGLQRWKATWSGTGVVLTNQVTGRAITVSGTPKDGAKLVATKSTGATAQRFMLTKRNLVENGMYVLHAGTGSRVADVSGASKADGANVIIWAPNGENNQKFQITHVSGGYYKIVNVNSNKALEAAGEAAGANVRQAAYKGSANQLWKAEISPNGGVTFVGKASGKALEVAGNANTSGANVRIGTKSGAKGQAWSLEATERFDPVLSRALARARSLGSATSYMIAVDLTNHRTVVFHRSGGSWQVARNVAVSTGAPGTPTHTGTYTIGDRGYSFGSGYTCYYWTQFRGPYYFHSVLYHQGTRSIMDGRLGYSISHGCVRMDINDAYYINYNIPSGTKVSVYY